MSRRLGILLLILLVVAPPALAKKKKTRPRAKQTTVQPVPPQKTFVIEPSDDNDALEDALREARKGRSVRVVHRPADMSATATPLAPAPGTGYRVKDVQINSPAYDGFASNFHAEPSIAAQGDAVVCAWNDSGSDSGSPSPSGISNTDGYGVSADRGATWADRGKRAPNGSFTSFDGDNVIAAGPDNDFYYLSDGGKNGINWSAMAVSRSTNGGVTWTVPTSPSQGVIGLPDGFFDKGWIAVDTSSTSTRGNVYVTWSDFGETATDLYFARSTDRGQTWSAQKLDRFSHPVAVTYVQVAANGLVYVGEQDEGTIVNGVFTGTNYVRVSADGGRTFSELRSAGDYRAVGERVALQLCGNPGFFGGLVRYLHGPIEADSSLRIAVDPSDPSGKTVFVTTQGVPDTPGDESDVFLWRSNDGGLTWADPVRVNDDTTKTDQFMPDLWIAPDGTLGVLWHDRRNDPKANWRLESWMAISKDGGRTFGCSFPVSSAPYQPVGRCQMNDYNGVYADERGFVTAWGDSRQVDPQKQQVFAIYGANVPLDGPGPVLSIDAVTEDPDRPGHLTFRLRNDGTEAATAISVSVTIDGVQTVAPPPFLRFPDVPACHGTAEATYQVALPSSAPFVKGTLTVQGPKGTLPLTFSVAPKAPAGVLLSADFESGLGDFTAQSGTLWHTTATCAATLPGHGGTGVAYFGNDGSCGWNGGSRIYGALTSKAIALPPGGAILRFKEAVGLYARHGSDRALVQISSDGGVSYENLWGFGYMTRYVLDPSVPIVANGLPVWHDVALDLSDYGGKTIVLRFFAYVGAGSGRGWAVDDVKIVSTTTAPLGAMGTCAAPQELTESLVVNTGGSAASSSDPAPSCGGGGPYTPFWTTFVPPVDGTYEFRACSTSGSAVLSVWSGECGSLTQKACGPVQDCMLASIPAPLTVQGQAGVPLRVLVSSATASAATQVSVSVTSLAEGTLVPIVLDVPPGRAHYTTELALTNHATAPAALALTYTASLGTGTGTVTETLAAGKVLAIPDVIAYLRGKGLSIPAEGAQAGTLRVVAAGVPSGSVSAMARTLAATAAPQPAGAASLAYPAVPLDGADRISVFGLRSSAQDRSRLALYNPSLSPVTVKVTVVSGSGDGKRVVYRAAQALAAGAWTQFDGVLEETGVSNGWAVIERVSASGTAAAYGVVNDNGTNDGSYLAPVSSAGAATTFTVPVLVETPRFASELVLSNQGSTDATLTLRYRESLDGSGGGATVTLTLPAGTQRFLADAVDYLRTNGGTLGPKGRNYAGALRVEVANAAPGDVWGAARVTAPSPAGGAFGLFVPAVYRGAEADAGATLDGLRADAANRANVAVVNAGSDSAGPVTLHLQAYDGATGAAAGAARTVTLEPGAWAQPADLFTASGAASGWVVVTRVSGSAPWIAYGVVNDGARPGERTDDGAYVPMRK